MLRHLGALGYFLFWVLAGSGIYLYVRFDTSVTGAYASIGELEWWFGGVLRSVHRYAADAFVLATLAHLVKELLAGRFRGFRAFSWISGVPLLWLLYASGIVGYWLVWDARSQFSLSAVLEWMRMNPASAEQPSDRMFSLFVFLHIGLPLALLAGMWVHVQRVGSPKTVAPRRLALWTLGALLALALIRPATSVARWDATRAPLDLPVDWFLQFIHPLMYATSPGMLWVFAGGLSLALILLPYLSKSPKLVPAQVDLKNCNGCGRCVADCPYEAVLFRNGKADVLAERCAACGICAGACPSSTPFRSARELVSGIDLPDATVQDLRARLQAELARQSPITFSCEQNGLRVPDAIAVRCLAALPPSFVEYALRHGASSVKAIGCEACAYRLGLELSQARFARGREPHLRANVVHSEQGHEHVFRLR